MASLKLMLNTSRSLKNGDFPLVFQIIHKRKKKLIYTPYKLLPIEFNVKNQKVSFISDSYRSIKEIRTINMAIKKQQKKIEKLIEELEAKECNYTVEDIITRYQMENNPLSLLNFIDLQIMRKKELGKEGITAAYQSTRASVSRFIGSRELTIAQIDSVFLRDYELYLRHRGVCDNTICFYLRNMKSIYNQAVTDGYHLPEENPFQKLHIKPRKTVKRALSKELLRRMVDLDLSQKKHLELSRDIFLFSFYSRGMSFVDIIFLKKPKDMIGYHRKKTKQWLHVTITPQLNALIKKYRNQSEYVFPILNPDSPKSLYKQYRLALERVNRNLKQVGELLGIETSLSTYVARHSWATQAKNGGAPIAVISEGLGHTSEETTRIYLKEFDQSVVDQLNEKVSRL